MVNCHNKINFFFFKSLHNIVVTCMNKEARETCINKRVVLLFGWFLGSFEGYLCLNNLCI